MRFARYISLDKRGLRELEEPARAGASRGREVGPRGGKVSRRNGNLVSQRWGGRGHRNRRAPARRSARVNLVFY